VKTCLRLAVKTWEGWRGHTERADTALPAMFIKVALSAARSAAATLSASRSTAVPAARSAARSATSSTTLSASRSAAAPTPGKCVPPVAVAARASPNRPRGALPSHMPNRSPPTRR